MNINYKQVDSIKEFIDAIRLRIDVFIKEQRCEPGWEPDEEDKTSKHYIALVGNKIVGTARVRQSKRGETKIERMVIDKRYRGKDIGEGLVRYIIIQTKKLKPKRIWMQAQVHAQTFYEKCGFRTISKPYDLWGVQHIDMELIPLDS